MKNYVYHINSLKNMIYILSEIFSESDVQY